MSSYNSQDTKGAAIMQTELVIAITSGLIALLTSFFVAVYQSRAEFRKLAKQLEETYTTSLFDKRLEVYPALFKALSQLSNAIEYKTQSKQQLKEFQGQFDSWLSSYALLLTPSTARITWRYHNYLIDLFEQYSDGPLPEEQWVEIRNIHVTIGKFLRAELGVFDTEPAGTPELEIPYVKDLLEKLGQRSKRVRGRFGY
jgi:hypothetical protein